jgi:hypothetical protein
VFPTVQPSKVQARVAADDIGLLSQALPVGSRGQRLQGQVNPLSATGKLAFDRRRLPIEDSIHGHGDLLAVLSG